MTDDPKSNRSSEDRALSRRGFNALSVAAGVVIAASSATARAADGAVVETDVAVKTPDGVCDAALFHPGGKGRWPTVLMWPDALGLRPAFRDMGRRLAGEGYAVLVPNPFYRTAKAPVLPSNFSFSNPADLAKLRPLMAPLTDDAVVRDAGAYLGFLDAQRVVSRKAKAGAVGYCMGGPLMLRTAAAAPDRIGAGCSFHGGGLVTDKPDSPHLLASRIKGSYYFGIATSDDQRQPDAKDKLKAAFAAAQVPAVIEVYEGAQHGWCVPDFPVYDHDKAERAWGDMVALYKTALV